MFGPKHLTLKVE